MVKPRRLAGLSKKKSKKKAVVLTSALFLGGYLAAKKLGLLGDDD